MSHLEQLIFSYGEKHNLVVGITTAEPFLSLEKLLRESPWKGFVNQDLEARLIPQKTMPSAKSIIAVAMNYNKAYKTSEGMRGYFSMGAVGRDYHMVLGEHLKTIAMLLKEEDPSIEAKGYVDTGPLVDRQVALRAGIGFIGKNGCIHTEKFGSAVFLGHLLVNVPLTQTEKKWGSCGSCDICLKACPSGALSSNGYQWHRCISYLTQKKGVLSRQEMAAMGFQLYGCDICQKACPHNRKSEMEQMEGEEFAPLIQNILEMSQKEFRETIGKTAAGWQGKKWIQRNAVAVLGNYKVEESLYLLEKALQDERLVIRQTAAAAIGNLGLQKGIAILQRALEKEQEEEAAKEMQLSLKQLKDRG